jgi:hypothetical protein
MTNKFRYTVYYEVFSNLEKEDEEHNAVAEATRILHLTYTVQSVQLENTYIKIAVAHKQNKSLYSIRTI